MKVILIGVICFVLVVAVALTGVLVAVLSGRMPIWGANGSSNLELVNRQVFPATSVNDLRVRYISPSITLIPTNGNEIVLEEYMANWEESMLAKISQSGTGLTIENGERPMQIWWRCDIKIYLPQKWMGALELQTSSGSVRCESAITLGSLTAISTSGSVRFTQVEAEGDIRMESSSGGVSSEELTAGGDIRLKSTSGSVRPGRVRAGGEITASSSSGGVRMDLADAPRIEAQSTSGSVSVREINGVFTLKSSSGGVDVDAGTGHGEAESTSGSVRMTLASLTGDLRLASSSGGCHLHLPRDTSFRFEGRTSSGGVYTPDDAGFSHDEKNKYASGTYGDGQHSVSMKATSGSVRLEWY